MPSKSETDHPMERAEKAFRAAFERLKRNEPERLPKGTPLSQNMVAREAGCDPSALKKSRYPSLIAEIQQWIREHGQRKTPSPRHNLLNQRRRNRSLRERIEAFKAERDHAISLLIEADARILELTLENARLQAVQPPSNVSPMCRPKGATSSH